MKFRPEQHFDVLTKEGFRILTSTRKHDKQTIVEVYHEEDLIKLEPVSSEEELSQWFWKYVEEFGGLEDGTE